ncbi:MAG: hypothetical protein A3H98_05880 [Bacteroidetes bacterium RIFCSPLOWO2_02_FULL_36_8]|nr:MAG: hypothetical protein A3H98_05880 [Bacteroidetes bacterium RIFCSPLOWO2_02_FULL_36_8]OFY68959.1 MAG: hypothetical protein A3G23_10385 [Bacteroidetes bacterium RIFCSPLOWO2_12_FULL_37_12]
MFYVILFFEITTLELIECNYSAKKKFSRKAAENAKKKTINDFFSLRTLRLCVTYYLREIIPTE